MIIVLKNLVCIHYLVPFKKGVIEESFSPTFFSCIFNMIWKSDAFLTPFSVCWPMSLWRF